jgi:hypothetical protein
MRIGDDATLSTFTAQGLAATPERGCARGSSRGGCLGSPGITTDKVSAEMLKVAGLGKEGEIEG